MYLIDTHLRELCERLGLVAPFTVARVNPASVDLGLGREFVNLSDQPIRYWDKPAGWDLPDLNLVSFRAEPGERFSAAKVELLPQRALLACTAETVRVPDSLTVLGNVLDGTRVELAACVAELRLKSSAARAGLDHALAGWVDPGFGQPNGSNLTLELHAHRPIELIAGKCYVQMVVAACLAAPEKSYQQTGRYIGQYGIGAVLARGDKEEQT